MAAETSPTLDPQDVAEQLSTRAEHLRAQLAQVTREDDTSHPADVLDLATKRQAAEQSADRATAITARLVEVEAALQRISEGTWGACLVCGEQIDPARLEVLPLTTHCREHAST